MGKNYIKTADGRHVARPGRRGRKLYEHDMAVPYTVTTRMKEVWSMLAFGLGPREIACNLNISPKTVEHHKYAVMTFFKIYPWDFAFYIRLAVAFGLVDTQTPIKAINEKHAPNSTRNRIIKHLRSSTTCCESTES